MKRIVIFYLALGIILAGLIWVSLTYGQTFTLMSDVTDMSLSNYRSIQSDGVKFFIRSPAAVSPEMGLVWDNSGAFTDYASYSEETRTNIRIATNEQTTPEDVTYLSGDHIVATFNTGTAYIYFPPGEYEAGVSEWKYYLATKWDSGNCYYVSTYIDTACTNLAQSAPASPTPPTPTPTSTPTPSVTPTPTVTPTPSPPPTPEPTPSIETTPTPEFTPTPTPVCVAVGDALKAWRISNAVINTPRSAGDSAFVYRWLRTSDDTTYCHVYDGGNFYDEVDTSNYGSVAVVIAPEDGVIEVRDGDYVTITVDGSALDVYFPDVYEETTLYIGDDGTTYTDATLCDVARLFITTPTPALTPSPTPVIADCLTLVSYPYQPEETSIYDLLNADFARILTYANEYCFRSPLGWGDLGPNVVGKVQMRDKAVTTTEIDDYTILSTNIARETLASWNVNTSDTYFDYWDVFPGAYKIPIPFKSADNTYEPKWQIECIPWWSGPDEGFKITLRDEDGEQDGDAMFFIDAISKFIGIYGIGEPTASLDVGGGMRVRGPLSLDEGLSFPWVKLAVNDTTPSVSGGMNFVTVNTSGTVYTDFDGGIDGQRILILLNDANSTFGNQSTASIWSAETAVDGWGDQDSFYQFVLYGTQWYQYAPSGPRYGHVAAGEYTPGEWTGQEEDFETNTWDGGQGWLKDGWVIDNARLRTTAYGPRGDYCVQLGEANDNAAYIYRAFDAGGIHASVLLTAYLKKTNGSVEVSYSDDSAASWNDLTTWASPGSSWGQLSYTWTSPPDQDELFIKFETTGNYSYIDDIVITVD